MNNQQNREGFDISDIREVYTERDVEKMKRDWSARPVKVWYDWEGDFLEVNFSDDTGYMVETENDAVMARLDIAGNVIGFSIMCVNRLSKEKPFEVTINPKTSTLPQY
jgi:Protein of unknown function (DUF2283)